MFFFISFFGDNMVNYDLEKIKKEIKARKRYNKKINISNFLYCLLNKVLITGLFTIITLIMLKKNNNFKNWFYKNVFENNFSFASVNSLYNKYFGGTLPFSNVFSDNISMVYNEKIVYSHSEIYLEGVKLFVSSNYFVPLLEDGLVVYVGDKEEYGNTVIVQQSDGVNVWYSNISNVGVKLYDYVSKGTVLGECNDYFYLVFKKDGKSLDYKKFI